MSKQAKRKITVNISPKIKTLPKTRPSVFERLGTKASSTHKEVCHHWTQHGTCPYGKGCKYSSTHTLISPSKQRLAKKENESKKRHSKEGVHKRQHSGSAKSTQSPEQVWNQWDATELEDVDAADLEKRREELQRELDLQMKMESKARKKEKKLKLESSPSTESSSSSTDSSSSSEESSSSSSSSVETTRRKRKKTKGKQRDSSSSSEREQIRKRKSKTKQHSFKTSHSDKSKKAASTKPIVKIVAKSPSPVRSVKKSQTPPPKMKPFVPVVNEMSKSKSPRPSSRSSDHKEKHRTPSPKLIKEKEREKEKEKQAKDREREKEKDREKEKEKEREREKEKEREREKEREKEKEREREREKLKERERERERGKEVRKREVKSPKRDNKVSKDIKRRESPDSTHSRDRKLSPSRSRGSGSAGSRRDNSRKNSPTALKDDRRSDKSREDRDRSRDRDRAANDKHRKDKRDSRDCTERDRDRERRITREEREAAREKDREEALARCQERQRERERLKELAKKEEENRNRAHREDRGLDKPTGDRVERLLPLPADRIPPNRRGRSPNNKRINNRDKSRDIRRDRTPDRSRSGVRKSVDRHDQLERDGARIEHIDRERMDRSYEHGYDRPDRNYDRDRNDDRKRDYGAMPPRLREPDRRHEEKNYESPYDRRLEDRRYLEMEDRFNENSRDDRIPLDTRDYPDDRRVHRDMWDVRDEREIERDRELDQRRFGREDSRPRSLKGREWDAMDYPDHEWDRGRRPVDWDARGGWDNRDHDPAQLEEEWRHYNRSMDSWTADDRRRWAEWRDRSRPQSTTSHQDAEEVNDPHKRELPKSDSVEFPPPQQQQQQQEVENKSDTVLGKRPAEENVESPIEPKKVCVSETPLEDNLSEISDDADEILNREEDPPEPQIEETLSIDSAPKPFEKEVQEVAEPSIASVPQKSPSPSRSPTRLPKEESIEDENMDLDFEEISEDELEEENRVKGLGDALGVDWASLVAESRPRHKPISSTKRRWESHNILVNIGISVEMAGEALVKEIFKKHEEEKLKEELEEKGVKNEEVKEETNHLEENESASVETPQTSDTIIPHPVAAIQVAIREKEIMRKTLFASAGPFRRALSARRDLAIRRHLCDLPINDTFVEAPRRHDPELYKQALELFERNL